MTAAQVPLPRPAVTYLPGRWLAFAFDDVQLLAQMPASGPLAVACWDRVSQGGGVDGVLGVIAQEGLRTVPNFALVGPGGAGGIRVVVSGKAQAEIFEAGRLEPATISAAESTTWFEQRVPGRPGVRLGAGADDGQSTVGLPLIGGLVYASALAVGVPVTEGRGLAPAGPPQPVDVQPVRNPSARPQPGITAPITAAPVSVEPVSVEPVSVEPVSVEPVSADTMPPRSDFDSGLIDSLPWRSPEAYWGETSQPEAPETLHPQPGPDPGPAGWSQAASQAATSTPWPDPTGQAPWPQADPPHSPWPIPPQQPVNAWSPASPAPGSVAQPVNPWARGGSPAIPPAAPPQPPGRTAQPQPARPADEQLVPMVYAVSCPGGHPNPSYATTCRICDEPIPAQEPFSAPRPSLGVLTLSTGDTVRLDRDVVLGRAPFHADENAASRPHLVQLASPGNDISRSHVRVSLENWFVQVTDLGSTNGTVVTLPGQAPVRLRAHDPFTILPGTTVNIADEVTLRFEVPL